MSEVKENKTVPLALLFPHERNYRAHPESQIIKIAASLERFGQVRSIVTQACENGSYTIVAGHGVVLAAERLKYSELRADILPASWSQAQIDGYLVADNNLSVEAVDDDTLLATLLQEQQDAGYDLASLGSDDETLRQMLEALGDEMLGESEEGDGGDEFDVTPDEGPTRTHVGEVWQLGEHRLCVGDCTKLEDVQRLIQDEKATLIVTSPPYWVGREYEQEHGKKQIIEHIEASVYFMQSAMDENSHIAINTGMTTETKQGGQVRRIWLLLDWWASVFDKYGWYMRNVRIWTKRGGLTSFTPAQDCVNISWEFLASFTRAKPKHQNRLGEGWECEGMWDCQPQTANVGHSAPFPLEIPSRYIRLYTDENDIVFEPYCGSGTTLIACERLGRKCRGMELDPRYADVILARYEAETGQTATLHARVEEVSRA